MASPPYKEGFPLTSRGVAEDGSQIRVETFGGFLTPEGLMPEGIGTYGHTYRLARTEAGWTSIPVDAPFSRLPVVEVSTMSPDFESSIWFAKPPGQSSLDVYRDLSKGTFTRMGPGAPPGALETVLDFVGGSKDLQHVLFLVQSASIGLEEEHLWPGDTTLGEHRRSLYEYAGTGHTEPELVGVKNQTTLSEAARAEGKSNVNEAAELISDCGTVLGGLPEGNAYNAVSASGATVFFTSAACGEAPAANELYARINREKTVALSEPSLSVPGRECTTEACTMAEGVPADRQAAAFAGASLDGSRVFFSTSQPLTDADTDGGPDLYEEDISAGRVTRLVQVSRGGAGDATPGSGADVLGVARISEDGSHVYFVAHGVLAGANREGKAPLAGEPNLYVAVRECTGGQGSCGSSVEHISFVATLSGADGGDWASPDFRPVQTTPDGRFMVFQSTADLRPDQEERKEAGQVFEYDAQTETLVRVSHGEGGYNEDGNSNVYRATIPVQGYGGDSPNTRFNSLALTADGSRVFFTTAAALTQGALNGFPSIYEYYDGHVALISSGHDVLTVNGNTVIELIGTDESGRDVFFTTGSQLVPQDRDTSIDVYDARSEGGFAPSALPAPCSGDSCQSAPSPSPQLLAPGVSSAGEQVVESPAMPVVKPKPKAKPRAKLSNALRACRAKHDRRKRAACESQARKKYGSRQARKAIAHRGGK